MKLTDSCVFVCRLLAGLKQVNQHSVRLTRPTATVVTTLASSSPRLLVTSRTSSEAASSVTRVATQAVPARPSIRVVRTVGGASQGQLSGRTVRTGPIRMIRTAVPLSGSQVAKSDNINIIRTVTPVTSST